MDFEEAINKILAVLPPGGDRKTFLFSATMTSKVAKLQRASLTDPVKVGGCTAVHYSPSRCGGAHDGMVASG